MEAIHPGPPQCNYWSSLGGTKFSPIIQKISNMFWKLVQPCISTLEWGLHKIELLSGINRDRPQKFKHTKNIGPYSASMIAESSKLRIWNLFKKEIQQGKKLKNFNKFNFFDHITQNNLTGYVFVNRNIKYSFINVKKLPRGTFNLISIVAMENGEFVIHRKEVKIIEVINGKECKLYASPRNRLERAYKIHKELSDANVPFIVKLLIYIKKENELFQSVQEYCDGEDLFTQLDDINFISPENKLEIIKQLTTALIYIHKKKFVHRDLKPDNVLLNITDNGTFEARLGDFDFITHAGRIDYIVGTPGYMAPEILPQNESDDEQDEEDDSRISQNTSLDTFALGMTAYAIKYGTEFSKLEYSQNYDEWLSNLHLNVHNPFDLIIRCLIQKKPENRPNAEKVLKALELCTADDLRPPVVLQQVLEALDSVYLAEKIYSFPKPDEEEESEQWESDDEINSNEHLEDGNPSEFVPVEFNEVATERPKRPDLAEKSEVLQNGPTSNFRPASARTENKRKIETKRNRSTG